MRNQPATSSHDHRIDCLNKDLAIAAVDLMSRDRGRQDAAGARIPELRRQLGKVLLERDKLERPWIYRKGQPVPALPPRLLIQRVKRVEPSSPEDKLQRRIDLCASKRTRAERLLAAARTAGDPEACLADVRRLERAHGALLLARDRRERPEIYAKKPRLPS